MGTIDQGGTCVAMAQCGPGTTDDGTGTCVPDGSIICTDGTMFDPAIGECVIDPGDCQDGTVLIGNQCVDPSKGLVADLEEATEPNGVGVLGEASQTPAGTISLKAIGTQPGFVIHGKLAPFRDLNGDGQPDPDVDTYLVTVTAPTLLHITVDGLHGVTGGFLAGVTGLAVSDPLRFYARLGLNVTGDTSRRQVFLPRAGTYTIAITDTRTLLLVGGAPSGEYYATIDQIAMPTATALTGTSPLIKTGTTTGDIQAYSFTPGTGTNDIQLAMPSPQAQASAVALVGGAFRAFNDESGPNPAHVQLTGLTASQTVTVIVDDVLNYALAPVAFTLTVHPM